MSIDPITFAPSSGCYLFGRCNFASGPDEILNFQQREADIGRKFDGHMRYWAWNSATDKMAPFQWSFNTDGVPIGIISWGSGSNPANVIALINQGNYDTVITNMANNLKTLNGNIILRMWWEFSGASKEWNPPASYGGTWAEFITAWRRVRGIFDARGASTTAGGNVAFCWCPQSELNGGAASWMGTTGWPGSDVVEWIGFDTYPKQAGGYRDLSNMLNYGHGFYNFYTTNDLFKKGGTGGTQIPLGVWETGILPQSVYGSTGSGTTREHYYTQALADLQASFPHLQAYEYFDSDTQGIDWKVNSAGTGTDTGAAALAAYAAFGADPYMNPAGGGGGGPGTAIPTISTSAASGVTTSAAQLNGLINPNNAATTYNFEYGLTTSYGTSLGNQVTGAGGAPIAVSGAVSGLAPATPYHFRLNAHNTAGTATPTADRSFTTDSVASGWTPQWQLPTLGQGTIVGRRTATMQVHTTWTTDAQAQQVAAECCFISGPYSMPRLAVMIAANPDLIFAPYLKSIQNPAGSTDFDSTGTKYPAKWYQHYMDGTKVKQTGAFLNWLMETGSYTEAQAAATVAGALSTGNITASSWAEYHLKDACAGVVQTNALAAQAGSHPFRGLWFDSEGTFSGDAAGVFVGTNPGKDPHLLTAYTKPNWLAMVYYLNQTAQNQTPGLLTINNERLFVAANGLGPTTTSIAQNVDMAMTEGWFFNAAGGGTTIQTSAAAFETQLQMMLDCQNLFNTCAEPLESGIASWTAAQQTLARRFTAGCNLLVNRGLITFEYGSTKGAGPWLETALDPSLYTMDLGAPLTGQSPTAASGHRVAVGASNGQASATGLYARLYDGGTVLVNITNAAINYKASKTYTRIPDLQDTSTPTTTAGNLISVPAGAAMFLTTSGGTGGTAPSNRRLPEVIGTPREGQELYRDQAAYTGSPAPIVTDQWQISTTGTSAWTNISAQTGVSYDIPFGAAGTATLGGTIAVDAMGGTVAAGLGTATTGGVWVYNTGGSADFAKAGGFATFSHPSANTGRNASLNINVADSDAKVAYTFPGTAAGGNMQATLCGRFQDTSNYYGTNLVYSATTGHISATLEKVVAGTVTTFGTAFDLGAYTPGVAYKVELSCLGNVISGAAWVGTASQPGTPFWTVNDSAFTAAGDVALRSYRGAGNTNTSPQTKADHLLVTSGGGAGTAVSLVGEYLRVQDTAINSAGTAVANSAAVGPIVAGLPTDPIWTTRPAAISGTPQEGQTVSSNNGNVSSTPAVAVTFQWETSATGLPGSWSDISSATSFNYTLPVASAGTYVRLRVIATNGTVTTTSHSPFIGPITAGTGGSAPVNTTLPAITGSPVAGQTLTTTQGVWTGAQVITNQWRRSTDGVNFTDIVGQTGLTYAVQTGDQGALIRVRVTATASGQSATAVSNTVGPVTLPTNFPDLTLQVNVE
jgi:hypothetical protein